MKCEKCNKEHNGTYGSGRFCEETCARSFSTSEKRDEINEKVSKKLTKSGKYGKYKRPVTYCLYCGLVAKNGNFCSNECRHLYSYNEYIKKWHEGIVDGTRAGGVALSAHIRRYLFIKYNNKCSKCGWNEKNLKTGKIPLQVDHIDGNSDNNTEENLDLLCPNCHSLTPTYGSLNNGHGNRKRLAYFRYRPPLSN